MLAVAGGEWAGNGVSEWMLFPCHWEKKDALMNWRRGHKAGRWKLPRTPLIVSSTRGSGCGGTGDTVLHVPCCQGRGWHLLGTDLGVQLGLQLSTRVFSWWACGNAGHVGTWFSGELGSAGSVVELG